MSCEDSSEYSASNVVKPCYWDKSHSCVTYGLVA